MANYHQYRPGVNSTGAYLVAGVPYITGSTTLTHGGEDTITFPYVTRSVTVMNHSSKTLRVHFAPAASNGGNTITGFHFVELDSDEDSITMNIRCKYLYVSAPSDAGGAREYRVIAELTPVSTHDTDIVLAANAAGEGQGIDE
jgi:hypothetical protein